MASGIVTIGTLSTRAGYEHIPASVQPAFKLWIASTGEAIVCYWYPPPTGDHLIYAFRQSNADRTQWSDEQIISDIATYNYNSDINRITAWKNPYNDDIHVAYLCYQGSRNYAYYNQLTHAPTGGWTVGERDLVNVSPYDLSGGNRQIQVSHDGARPWIVIHLWEGYYEVYPYNVIYRTGGSPQWVNAGVNSGQGNRIACAIGSKVGHSIALVLDCSQTHPNSFVKASYYFGTTHDWQEDRATLWTHEQHGLGMTEDDRQNMGLAVYPLTHANVDFIAVTRINADASLRLWKYKIGVGWTGEVVLKVGGVSAQCTEATWDADAGVMYFWYNSTDCLQWDPNDDSVVDSGMVGARYNQMTQTVYDSKVHGFHSSGANGNCTLYYKWTDRSFLRKAQKDVLIECRLTIPKPIVHTLNYESRHAHFLPKQIPLAATGWVYPVDQVPDEFREWIGRVDCPGHHKELVFEQLHKAQLPHESPMAFEGTLQNGIWIKGLPLEFRTTLETVRPVPSAQSQLAEWGAAEWGAAQFAGEASDGAMYDPGHLQIEWRKAWPWRTAPFAKDVWIEVCAGLWTTRDLLVSYVEPIVVVVGKDMAMALDMPIGTVVQIPWESAWPLTAAVYHTWTCLRMSLGLLPHTWRVFNVAGTPFVQHDWTVRSQQGNNLAHLWRVLPGQLLLLHGEDIQLPFANLEKKA